MARSIGEDRPGAHWHVRLFDGVAAVGSHVVATYAEARGLTAKHARGFSMSQCAKDCALTAGTAA